MLLAVPAIMLIAASTSAALRSGIFVSAICLTWSRVSFCDLGLVRYARTALDARRLFNKDYRRRSLCYKSERMILKKQ